MNKIALVTTCLMATLAFGCTTTSTDFGEETVRGVAALANDPRLGEEVSRICFASQIDGFRAASRDTVIVESGFKDEFVLGMMGSCQNLQQAQAIALDTGLSCLTEFDNIIVFDSAFGKQTSPFSQEKCAIKSIHRWNEGIDDTELGGIDPKDIEPIMEPLE